MSEPVLKALMQLFALISDVNDQYLISGKSREIVRQFLSRHLNNEAVVRYVQIFDEYFVLYHTVEITKENIKKENTLHSLQ